MLKKYSCWMIVILIMLEEPLVLRYAILKSVLQQSVILPLNERMFTYMWVPDVVSFPLIRNSDFIKASEPG